MTGILKKLANIQQELKAPKNQYNKFGEFPYRSAEDILEGLKLLLKKHDCVVRSSEELIGFGNAVYVKSIAFICDESGEISATAFAREEVERPKMQAPQLTGSSSSYAKKYALGNLFLIDDTKDPDSMKNDNTVVQVKKVTNTPQNESSSLSGASGSPVSNEMSEDSPKCPECKSDMVKRKGKNGDFWGCSMWGKTKCGGTRIVI